MKYWWVSWWQDWDELGSFTLYTPWWISGFDGDGRRDSVCAAIKAETEEEIEEIIYNCYDRRPREIDFRFITPKPFDWHPSPDGGRFQWADWMDKYWWNRDSYIQAE